MKDWFYKRAATRRMWLVFWGAVVIVVLWPLSALSLLIESVRGAAWGFADEWRHFRRGERVLWSEMRRSWSSEKCQK